MLQYVIPLLGSYFDSYIFPYLLLPVLACAILATIPCIIRAIVRSK